jgi:peptide/nickel transport system ATP-binding protein
MSSEQNKVILRAEHISKTYGEKKVLEDISIYLEQGELVSLLGVSGSGKTTLFNVLSGIIPPDEGKVYLKDQDVTSTPGSISYMLQKDLLLPHKKVIDNVALPLVLKGVKKAEAREKANPLFAEFGLEGTQYQYPSQLSGGMRQRVCIAIGLACNPRLIIADEPTTALDVTIQAQILDLMRNLKDKINSSIMLITHDLGVIAEMADYVVVMYAGRVVEKGTASEIFKNPSHPYTIGLMRSKPVVGKKVDKLYSIPGKVPNPIDMPDYCYFRDRCELSCDKCQGSYPGVIKLSPTHEVSCYRYADRPEAGWLANVHPGEGGKTHE